MDEQTRPGIQIREWDASFLRPETKGPTIPPLSPRVGPWFFLSLFRGSFADRIRFIVKTIRCEMHPNRLFEKLILSPGHGWFPQGCPVPVTRRQRQPASRPIPTKRRR